MATYTPGLNLKKPEETELYSVADQNENMDKIDAGIPSKATLAEAIDGTDDSKFMTPADVKNSSEPMLSVIKASYSNGLTNSNNSAMFSPDGKKLVYCDTTSRIVHLITTSGASAGARTYYQITGSETFVDLLVYDDIVVVLLSAGRAVILRITETTIALGANRTGLTHVSRVEHNKRFSKDDPNNAYYVAAISGGFLYSVYRVNKSTLDISVTFAAANVTNSMYPSVSYFTTFGDKVYVSYINTYNSSFRPAYLDVINGEGVKKNIVTINAGVANVQYSIGCVAADPVNDVGYVYSIENSSYNFRKINLTTDTLVSTVSTSSPLYLAFWHNGAIVYHPGNVINLTTGALTTNGPSAFSTEGLTMHPTYGVFGENMCSTLYNEPIGDAYFNLNSGNILWVSVGKLINMGGRFT